MKGSSLARFLGASLAHLQHGFDRLGEWGFHTMREAASRQSKSEKPKTFVNRLKKLLRNTFGIIGDAGDAYYATYEGLKRKRNQ